MGLPFEPESLESAKARFAIALVGVWDGDALASGKATIRPGQQRKYVFDFYEGVRMVACLEFWRVCKVVKNVPQNKELPEFRIHLSFSSAATTKKANALEDIRWLCFVFCGPRQHVGDALNETRDVIHFFYAHEPTPEQRAHAEKLISLRKFLAPGAKKPPHGGWPTPNAGLLGGHPPDE